VEAKPKPQNKVKVRKAKKHKTAKFKQPKHA